MEGLDERDTGRWEIGMGPHHHHHHRHRRRHRLRRVRRKRQSEVSSVPRSTLKFVTLLLVMLSPILVLEMTGVESFLFAPDCYYTRRRRIYLSGRRSQHPELPLPQPLSHTLPHSSLYMSSRPPSPRQPRRMLQKRTNRQKKRTSFAGNNQVLSSKTAETKKSSSMMADEIRPLIKSVSRERGTDYWIDPADYEREARREQERLDRLQKLRTGGGKNNDKMISDEKLWSEVKAPYKQNWIGYFSVMVAILSMLLTKFPELLEPTTIIQYPDL